MSEHGHRLVLCYELEQTRLGAVCCVGTPEREVSRLASTLSKWDELSSGLVKVAYYLEHRFDYKHVVDCKEFCAAARDWTIREAHKQQQKAIMAVGNTALKNSLGEDYSTLI